MRRKYSISVGTSSSIVYQVSTDDEMLLVCIMLSALYIFVASLLRQLQREI